MIYFCCFFYNCFSSEDYINCKIILDGGNHGSHELQKHKQGLMRLNAHSVFLRSLNEVLHNRGMLARVDRRLLDPQKRVLFNCHRLVRVLAHYILEDLVIT